MKIVLAAWLVALQPRLSAAMPQEDLAGLFSGPVCDIQGLFCTRLDVPRQGAICSICIKANVVFCLSNLDVSLSAVLMRHSQITTFSFPCVYPRLRLGLQRALLTSLATPADFVLALPTCSRPEKAARKFVEVSPEPGSSFDRLLAPEDIAMYGGLCALATFTREEMKRRVLDNSSFKNLDLVPQVPSYIQTSCLGHYLSDMIALCSLLMLAWGMVSQRNFAKVAEHILTFTWGCVEQCKVDIHSGEF